MKILALEAYYGGSHRAFLDGLMRHSRHDIRAITLAARFWKWRMQGGAVTLAEEALRVWGQGFRPELILATDMVNLPAFLALVRKTFADLPVLVYFHENQLTYPLQPDQDRDYTYAYINYLSCLAADRVIFNSRFHRDEFSRALLELLRRFPDHNQLATVHHIEHKSTVLHLGLDLEPHDLYASTQAVDHGAPIILWNQRWEYDKDPEGFFRIMDRLDGAGEDFRLILAGEQFRQQPQIFEQARQRYAGRVLHYGYAASFSEYSHLLNRADLVVSTARHEFFGIAIMEAIYCGCHPLLPNRLTYPELIPPELQPHILYEDDDQLFEMVRQILHGETRPLSLDVLKAIPAHLDWRTRVGAYDEAFETAIRT